MEANKVDACLPRRALVPGASLGRGRDLDASWSDKPLSSPKRGA